MTHLYPLAAGEPLPAGKKAAEVRAEATGVVRPPRKGEWYLSGAIIEAYRAPNDLSTAFQIAKLKVGKMVF
jgi:hypothetical protein